MEASAEQRAGAESRSGLWFACKKLALLAVTTVLAVNVWTGGPLLAIWVGSRIQKDTLLSMTTVFVVVLVLAVTVFSLGLALAWLNERYDQMVGRPPAKRERYPWMRSLRAEAEGEEKRRRGVSGPERVVIGSVVVAVLAFEFWFFFLARYSFGGG